MATLTVKELSEELDTTPRITRKFLRHVTPSEEHPGKGGRWQIEKRQLRSMKKQFHDFEDEHMRDGVAGDDTDTTPVDLIEDDSNE